jgi:hypothetical protein
MRPKPNEPTVVLEITHICISQKVKRLNNRTETFLCFQLQTQGSCLCFQQGFIHWLWLPYTLKGKFVEGTFVFDDNDNVVAVELTVREKE